MRIRYPVELMEEYGSPSLFFATLPDQAQPIMLYTDELDNLMNNSPNSPVQDRWLSVDELAGYVGIKRDTVYKWIMRRNMPAHKVGRLWKFRKEEIDVWVRSGAAGEREK